MVWSTAKGDLELRAEGEEGHGRQRLDKEPRCLAASVPELSLGHGRATEMPWKGFQPRRCPPAVLPC